MPKVVICHLDDPHEFAHLREPFETDNPGLVLTRVTIDQDTVLRSEQGGMRVFWIYHGAGEVLVPKGYRTKEGDGQRLPDDYQPDAIDPAFAATLTRIHNRLASLSPGALVPVRAILNRWQRAAFIGDYAGELWKLDHVARPWSTDHELEADLQSLFAVYRRHGYSTKQADSFEPLIAGDQLIATADEAVHVRGRFHCLALENVHRPSSHVSAVRRLRYLADTAGGCNPDFDPFRRLPLTWYYN